jgi:hypothetical protein
VDRGLRPEFKSFLDIFKQNSAPGASTLHLPEVYPVLPCQVSRCRRDLDSNRGRRWRSGGWSDRGAGLKGFLHILNKDSAS